MYISLYFINYSYLSACIHTYIYVHNHNYPVVQALLISEELANVPFLVLGNKIDLGSAPSEEDLRYQLGLYETYGKEVRKSLYYDSCTCVYV